VDLVVNLDLTLRGLENFCRSQVTGASLLIWRGGEVAEVTKGWNEVGRIGDGLRRSCWDLEISTVDDEGDEQ